MLGLLAEDAEKARAQAPAQALLDQLSQHMKALEELIDDYEKQIRTAGFQRVGEAIARAAEVFGLIGDAGLEQAASSISAQLPGHPEWISAEPDGWPAEIEAAADDTVQAHQAVKTLQTKINEANQASDFAAAATLAAEAATVHENYAEHRAGLVRLFAPLAVAAGVALPDASASGSSGPAGNGNIPREEAPPAEDSARPMEGAGSAPAERESPADTRETGAGHRTTPEHRPVAGGDKAQGAREAAGRHEAPPVDHHGAQRPDLGRRLDTARTKATGSGRSETPVRLLEADEGTPPGFLARPESGSAKEEGDVDFPEFSVQVPVAQLIEDIRSLGGRERAFRTNALVWRLLADDEPGLAAHVAAAIRAEHGERYCSVSPELIQASVLAASVLSASGERAIQLRELVSGLFALDLRRQRKPRQTRLGLYVLAAALRPSLVAPDTTGAHDLLDSIPHDEHFQALDQLRQTILDYRRLGFAQNPAFLRTAHEINAWKRALSEVQREAGEWWVGNRQRVIKYHRATIIWNRWLSSAGPLGRLLEMLRTKGAEAISEVESLAREWSDENFVTRAIHETGQSIRGRAPRLPPIEGAAKQTLLRHVREVTEFAERWLEVAKARPDDSPEHRGDRAREWRDKIQTIAPQCLQELDALEGESPDSLETEAAVAVARRAVQGFISVLDDGLRQDLVPYRHCLHAHLLRLPEPPRTTGWEPAEPPALDELLPLTLTEEVRWTDVLERHHQRCDLLIAERVAEVLRMTPDDRADIEKLDARQSEAERSCRAHLAERRMQVANAIEFAVGEGHIPESERIRHIDRLEAISPEQSQDIRRDLEVLDEIEAFLAEGREAQLCEVRERLHATDLESENPALFGRIAQLLEEGDTLTANEYIALSSHGQEIPQVTPASDPLQEYFPDQVARLIRFLASRQSTGIADAIRAGKTIGPVTMDGVPGTQAKSAADMVRAWHMAKEHRDPLDRHVQVVLERIGFQVRRVVLEERRTGGREQWLDIHTVPLEDRNVSDASGFCGDYIPFLKWLFLASRTSFFFIFYVVSVPVRSNKNLTPSEYSDQVAKYVSLHKGNKLILRARTSMETALEMILSSITVHRRRYQ